MTRITATIDARRRIRLAGVAAAAASLAACCLAWWPMIASTGAEAGDRMPAFSITTAGDPPLARVSSDRKLTPQDFDLIAAGLRTHSIPIERARKIAFVAVRDATAGERVETFVNGRETSNTAVAGDKIVTNLTPARDVLRDRDGHPNTYVVSAGRFAELYQPDSGSVEPFGVIHKAMGVVDAIACPGGFDIVAPWGERQQGASGYLLRNGDDVYGIEADAYAKTYQAAP